MRYIFSFFVFIMAASTISGQQNPTVFTYRVDNFEISLLNESQGEGNKNILIGATPEMLAKAIPDGKFANAVNAFLIRTPDKNILVDTGFGTKLFDNLKAVGVSPEQIDILLLTHMHGDHIGGMLKDGCVTFGNAAIYVSDAEFNYWMDDEKMNAMPVNRRGNFELVRKVVAAYKNNFHLFTPSELDGDTTSLLPGVTPIAAYGHTPGHTMFLLESEDKKLLIWGDLTHAMAVQMPYPQISVTYDVDPEKARISRVKTLEFIEKNNIPVAGMHVPYPAMGKINTAQNGGYRFTPLNK